MGETEEVAAFLAAVSAKALPSETGSSLCVFLTFANSNFGWEQNSSKEVNY